MKCVQCESEAFEEVNGHLVCRVCGLQSSEALVTVVEDLLDAEFDEAGNAQRARARIVHTQTTRSLSWVQWEEAIQTILRAQCEILVSDFAFPQQFTQIVGRLWFHYLASDTRIHRSSEFGGTKQQREHRLQLERMRKDYIKEQKVSLKRAAKMNTPQAREQIQRMRERLKLKYAWNAELGAMELIHELGPAKMGRRKKEEWEKTKRVYIKMTLEERRRRHRERLEERAREKAEMEARERQQKEEEVEIEEIEPESKHQKLGHAEIVDKGYEESNEDEVIVDIDGDDSENGEQDSVSNLSAISHSNSSIETQLGTIVFHRGKYYLIPSEDYASAHSDRTYGMLQQNESGGTINSQTPAEMRLNPHLHPHMQLSNEMVADIRRRMETFRTGGTTSISRSGRPRARPGIIQKNKFTLDSDLIAQIEQHLQQNLEKNFSAGKAKRSQAVLEDIQTQIPLTTLNYYQELAKPPPAKLGEGPFAKGAKPQLRKKYAYGKKQPVVEPESSSTSYESSQSSSSESSKSKKSKKKSSNSSSSSSSDSDSSGYSSDTSSSSSSSSSSSNSSSSGSSSSSNSSSSSSSSSSSHSISSLDSSSNAMVLDSEDKGDNSTSSLTKEKNEKKRKREDLPEDESLIGATDTNTPEIASTQIITDIGSEENSSNLTASLKKSMAIQSEVQSESAASNQMQLESKDSKIAESTQKTSEGHPPARKKKKKIEETDMPDFEPPKIRTMALTDLKRSSETLHLTLEILMVAVLYMRLPVLPTDLLDWAATGRIPYLTAYKLLPTSMSYFRALKPLSLPRYNSFLRRVLKFQYFLSLPTPLPTLPAIPLITRMATLLDVAPEIERAAIRLTYINPNLAAVLKKTSKRNYEHLMAHLIIALKLVYRFDDTYVLSPFALKFESIQAKTLPQWLEERFKIERNKAKFVPWTRSDLDHLPRGALYDLIDFLRYQNTSHATPNDVTMLQTMFDSKPGQQQQAMSSSSTDHSSSISSATNNNESSPYYDSLGNLITFGKNSLSGKIPVDAATRPFCPTIHDKKAGLYSSKNKEMIKEDTAENAEERPRSDRIDTSSDSDSSSSSDSSEKDPSNQENGENAEKIPENGDKSEPKRKQMKMPRVWPYRVYETTVASPGDWSFEYVLKVASSILGTSIDELRHAVQLHEHRLFPIPYKRRTKYEYRI